MSKVVSKLKTHTRPAHPFESRAKKAWNIATTEASRLSDGKVVSVDIPGEHAKCPICNTIIRFNKNGFAYCECGLIYNIMTEKSSKTRSPWSNFKNKMGQENTFLSDNSLPARSFGRIISQRMLDEIEELQFGSKPYFTQDGRAWHERHREQVGGLVELPRFKGKEFTMANETLLDETNINDFLPKLLQLLSIARANK